MTDEPAIGVPNAANLPKERRGAQGDNNPLTVSELARVLKEHVEGRFANISVRGEISGVKISRLGHLYFTLKDEKAVLDAVCWKGAAQRLTHKPEEGLEVVVYGSLSTYPKHSRYQISVYALEPAGTGALLQLLERRKKKLAAEGLFAPKRKRALPMLPRRIAVFTSEQGAVWQDILQRLTQRCPVNVTLFPVAVQGREAEKSLLQAFALLREARASAAGCDLEVVIVARGGGSIEDLWVFNEESIVRAAVACPLPVVSAIGHESDECLLDYAADLRAPTPTAAVELVVPQKAALLDNIRTYSARTRRVLGRCLKELQSRLQTTSLALPRALQTRTTQARERLQRCTLMLRNALRGVMQDLKACLLRQRLSTRWLVDSLARARARLGEQEKNRQHAMATRVEVAKAHLLRQRLSARWLVDSLARARARLGEQEKRQQRAIATRVGAAKKRLLHNRRLLDSLSFQRVMERGYAIVRKQQGIVRSANALQTGESFETLFADYSLLSAVARSTTSPPTQGKEARLQMFFQPCLHENPSHPRETTPSPPPSPASSPARASQQERLKL